MPSFDAVGGTPLPYMASGVASGPAVPPGGARNFKKIMRKCFIVKPN